MDIGETIKEHPGWVIGGGIVLLVIFYYYFSSSSSSTSGTSTSTSSSSSSTAASEALAAQQMQDQTNLSMASMTNTTQQQGQTLSAEIAMANTNSQNNLGAQSINMQKVLGEGNIQTQQDQIAAQVNMNAQNNQTAEAIAGINAATNNEIANTMATSSELMTGMGALSTIGTVGMLELPSILGSGALAAGGSAAGAAGSIIPSAISSAPSLVFT